MAIDKIHLRKLLRLFYAPANLRIRLLRDDIRSDLRDSDGGGGDFHGPFWADARNHALGTGDLYEATVARVNGNKSRERLYPELRDGFLTYWNEKRRWHNEPLSRPEIPPHARLMVDGLGAVKVENVLAVESGPEFRRLIYGYFAEKPSLTDEGGRLALWAMAQALPTYPIEQLRILDVLRSKSFTVGDYPMQGDEEGVFRRRYQKVVEDWKALRATY